MADVCIICGCSGTNLTQCKDINSWSTLYQAAVIRNHKEILDICQHEGDFPEACVINYHCSCRADFTLKRNLEKIKSAEKVEHNSTRRSSRDGESSSVILPDLCIFCKKSKYKPNTKTREKLHSVQEFRADDKVRNCATLHVQQSSGKSVVAREIIGICSKDLMSSEARYHASCYKNFVRISYATSNDEVNRTSTIESKFSELQPVYNTVYNFCEDLIANPRAVEFRVIKEVFINKANELGVNIPESDKKNLIRKITNMFPELQLVYYQYNKPLVYPDSLAMDEVVLNNFMLNSELEAFKVEDKSENNVIRVARLLNSEVRNLQPQMSWPPNEEELTPDKIPSYIPHLLDVFLSVLISGHSLDSDKSKTEKTLRLKESFAQDIVFSVTNGAVKTPKSVLFPSVVKAICNNTKIVKLINKYGHGISYDLVEEIETEFALKVINEQSENRVVIPADVEQMETSAPVAIMIADNIDNLEHTLSGSGTSHRVNSILVTERKHELDREWIGEVADYTPPTKEKCKRSLPSDVVTRVIPEYYGGKRIGPGELPHVQNLGLTNSPYEEKAKDLRQR